MPADLHKARELFLHAVGKLPVEEWQRYLAQACCGDSELQRQVEHLLRVHRQAGSFLERPAAQLDLEGKWLVGEKPSADGLPSPGAANDTQAKRTHDTQAVPTDLTPGESREYPEIPGYEILGICGYGGMGVVYRARQRGANRLVALKMIRAFEHASPTERLRFQIETEAVARLQHPHIVQLYEVGEVRGQPFFSLEFCDGGTLTEQLEKQRSTPQEAAALMETLARAMHYAHLRGVVHRDLKPGNVLLAGAERVAKITDFGLAKRIDAEAREISQSGAIMGTASYMAPEQAAGKVRDTGPAADVYALGALLYECLTGRPPFEGPQHVVLVSVLSDEPVPPSRRVPKVPADLETICLKCLSKDPAERYASAEAVAEDLRRFLADRPIRARRAGPWERTWRWCRRNQAVASLLAAVAALLIAVSVVSTFYAAHHKTAATDLAGALTKSRLREAEALIGQAHGTRLSRRPGQRIEALTALEKAAAIGRELDQPPEWFDRLRTEAIAALALPDVEVLQEWEGWPAGSFGLDFDGNLERYARLAIDGTVSVRRVSDDAEIARWQEPTEGDWPESESNLRFSPDGRFLCIRHLSSGRLTVRRLDGPEPIMCYQGSKARGSWAMDFSPDGKRLAYLQKDSRIVVVDLTSGQVRYLPPTGAEDQEHFEHIEFAPDGRRFAVSIRRAGKWAVEVRDAATGQVQGSFPHPKGADHPAWHPDGRTLATCCEEDHLIRLWDLASGRLLRVLEGHKTGGMRCAFTLSGDRLLSNDWHNMLRIWEPSSGRQLLSFSAAGFSILRVNSDDRLSAVRVADRSNLQLLRLHAGLEYRTIGPGGSRSWGINFNAHPLVHPGGRMLAATAEDGSVVLIDLAAGRQVAVLPDPNEFPLLWEPSGDLLTCGTSGLLRWPVRADPAAPARYRLGPPEQLLPDNIHERWGSSADGQTIAIPNYSRGAVVVYRSRPGRTIGLQPQQDVRCCAVSPDGRWVATGSHGNTDGLGAKVWDAATGELAKEFRVPGLCEVTFSPDSRWLLTTGGGCRLWEVGSWTEGPKVVGASGCFSPDGRLLAVEDSPGAIRLVRSESGGEVARLEAPEQTRLMPRCFTPDGTRLIAVGADTRALHVWDLSRIGKELVRLGLDWDALPYPDAGSADHSPLEVINLGPADLVRAHTERGIAHAQHARWDEAAAEYAALVQLRPDDHWLWYQYACLCLQRGDDEGYRGCCAALLKCFAGTADASIADRVALACLLLPGAVSDLKLPTQLAARGVAGAPGNPWHLLTLGAAHYRAGRHAEAINRLREALKAARANPDGYRYASILSRLFLAMAYHSAGQTEGAREWLDQAVQVIDLDLPRAGRVPLGYSWHDWIMCQVIRREAEALIGGQSKKPKK